MHALFEPGHGLAFSPLKEQRCIAYVVFVVGALYESDTGTGTTPDLVQKAWPGAVREYRVLTGPQAKHFLHKVDAFPDSAGAGKRAEIAVMVIEGTAVEPKPGKFVPAQDQVWVRFIVTIQYVISWS